MIARALILWDSVEPSTNWIMQQLPLVVRDAYKQMRSKMKSASVLVSVLETEDSSEIDGRRYCDETVVQGGEEARQYRERPREGSTHLQDYDCQVVRQIYTFVVAGSCFALGLRFAGTCDKSAAAAVFHCVLEFQTLRDATDPASLVLCPEPQILETCLGCCAISLAIIQAGSGNLETLKLFKILRWRCDEKITFGSHLWISMAIGLLFLGGGTCTLERTPEAIAALVAAFFPRFPITTTDNQYHLQALRHLYALAVKRRVIRFIDVNTGDVVPLPIEVCLLCVYF